jgi:hypothetical protein
VVWPGTARVPLRSGSTWRRAWLRRPGCRAGGWIRPGRGRSGSRSRRSLRTGRRRPLLVPRLPDVRSTRITTGTTGSSSGILPLLWTGNKVGTLL